MSVPEETEVDGAAVRLAEELSNDEDVTGTRGVVAGVGVGATYEDGAGEGAAYPEEPE